MALLCRECIICVTIWCVFFCVDEITTITKRSFKIKTKACCWCFSFGSFLLICINCYQCKQPHSDRCILCCCRCVRGDFFSVFHAYENTYCINSLLFSRRCILSSSHRSPRELYTKVHSAQAIQICIHVHIVCNHVDAGHRDVAWSRERWKVRAQFKWCADQNYGFEVWSKGLPACNQRCDNRWAHRKCLIMSIIIMNGWQQQLQWCKGIRCCCRASRNGARSAYEEGNTNRDQSTQFTSASMQNKKPVCCTYRLDCVPVFHRYFSLFLYRCVRWCSANSLAAVGWCVCWFFFSSSSSRRSFGMAKRLVCSYLLVTLLSSFSQVWVWAMHWNLLISFNMRMQAIIVGLFVDFFLSVLSLSLYHIRLMSIYNCKRTNRYSVQVLFISRLHVPVRLFFF